MKISKPLFLILVLVLMAPYLLVLRELKTFELPLQDLIKIYWTSCTQAMASTLLTLTLAVPGALGLFYLHSRWPKFISMPVEFLLLLPSLLPRLFVLVSVLNVIPFFPFNMTGVVLLHALSEWGLASFLLHRTFQHHLAPYIEMSQLSGVSRSRFLKTAFRLVVSPLSQMGLMFFLFFLSSVSVPLILAGGQFSSVEAVLYQKIFVAHDWMGALSLFLVHTGALILVLALCVPPKVSSVELPPSWPTTYLSSLWGLIAVSVPVLIIFTSLILKIPLGLMSLAQQYSVLEGWLLYLMGSLVVGLLAGGGVFLALSVLSYFALDSRYRRWFSVITSPSLMILAFAFFLLPGQAPQWQLIKISVALTFGFLPALLRLGLLQKIESLKLPAEVNAIMGASSWKIFSQGLWPQLVPNISWLSGLGAMWAMGDFAVSRLIAGKDITLSMWIQSLVDQYRWDMALLLAWLSLLTSFVVFMFFWSLSYVAHQKLNEKI